MSTCPRCRGRLFWDALEGEAVCLPCGYRATRAPTAAEGAAVRSSKSGEEKRGRKPRDPWPDSGNGYAFLPCQYTETDCFGCILTKCKHEAPLQARERIGELHRRQIQELRDQGVKPNEVAAQLSVSRRTVFRLSRHPVKVSQPSV